MPRLGAVPLLLLFAYLVADVSSMTPREEPSSDSGDGSKRTLFSIIWGCVSTTIICAWSATHPNIPPREETFKAIIRRLELMGLALMAPEVLPAFALNQLFAAVKIRNEYNKARGYKTSGFWENIWETAVKKRFSLYEIKEDESGGGYLHPEWTLAHGFFIIMGGIRLVEPAEGDVASVEAKTDDVPEMEKGLACGTPVKPRVTILTREMLGPVLAKGIEIKVTDEEMANTAKGDGLSKTIFIVKTSWFMVQCITRAAQGLALTELELTTLALASVNGITLLLWWKKPLGAKTVVPVNLRHKLTDQERNGTELRTDQSNRSHILPHLKMVFLAARDILRFWSQPKTGLHWDCPTQPCQLSNFHDIINRLLELPWALRLPIAVAALLLFPIITLALYASYTLGDVVLAGSSFFPVDATRVPTFYAPKRSSSSSGFFHPLVMMTIATGFGAIHCAGWNFIFPTYPEQILWRLSSIVVVTVPFILFVILLIIAGAFKLLGREDEEAKWKILSYSSLPFLLLYVAARVVILVEAIALLRHQPPSAFTVVDWFGFYPHVF